MSILTIFLAFMAGGLTILSPCILPIAPMVIGSALTQHRHGAFALALGLGLGFAVLGVALSFVEALFGFDVAPLRGIGAVLLIVLGGAVFLPKTYDVFAIATGPLSNWANNTADTIKDQNLISQFGLGALLALVWSPCVGPTLGAAYVLSSQGESLIGAGLTMLAFGFGAGGTLLILGQALGGALKRHAGAVRLFANHGRAIFATAMIVVGILVLTQADLAIGRWAVANSPDWLVALTTRF